MNCWLNVDSIRRGVSGNTLLKVMTDRTDQIAREAARLLALGRAPDVLAAIQQAAGSLRLGSARLPSVMRVRKHAQAMAMQAMGQPAYERRRHEMWREAEELMTVLEHAVPHATTLLVGRAALGHLDADAHVHLRIYTRQSVERIAESLREHGWDDARFETFESRHGRLGQIVFDGEHWMTTITRCMPEWRSEASLDLATGRAIAVVELADLRDRLAQFDHASQ